MVCSLIHFWHGLQYTSRGLTSPANGSCSRIIFRSSWLRLPPATLEFVTETDSEALIEGALDEASSSVSLSNRDRSSFAASTEELEKTLIERIGI